MITRPDCSEVIAYRAHVDRGMENLITASSADALAQLVDLVEIGLHHEQQHQELILTDILHAFSENPLVPAYDPAFRWPRLRARASANSAKASTRSGTRGTDFCFDNEGPAHRALVGPVRIARALVTNGEWRAFMRDGGYARPDLWLSDGWATCAPRAGALPATGARSTAPGNASRWAACAPIDEKRRSAM